MNRSENGPGPEVSQTRRYKEFSTIDWVEDGIRENREKRLELQRIRKSGLPKWRIQLSKLFFFSQEWITLAVIGICIGLIAGCLNIVTEWTADIKTGRCSIGLYLNRDFCCAGREHCEEWNEWGAWFLPVNYIVYILFSVLFGFCAAFLVYSFAPYAAGSGISEIKCIIAGFVMDGFLSARTLAIKSITLPLAIASGLSVGKEGPSVHYAVCVGYSIASNLVAFREHNAKMREVLIACSAAGVAVAFGSPMGGVLFAIEEMSNKFQLSSLWRSYFCCMVATGALAAVNAFRTGQLVLFSVRYDRSWHMFEIPFFVIIGLFGGLYGLFVIKWNLRAQAFRKRYLSNYAVEEATFLVAITAVICYFNRFLRIDMTESMQILFRECESQDDPLCSSSHRTGVIFSLTLAVIIRTLLVIISYGAKVPAGIFVPSMAIGALFGRLVGTLVQALHDHFPHASFFAKCPVDSPCITPGTYAFLGAAASLSGIMNLTITVVIIMFELTGALLYIVPAMIVVGVVRVVNDLIGGGKGGIADQAIWANGFPYLDNKEAHHFGDVKVEEAMVKTSTSVEPTEQLISLKLPVSKAEMTKALSADRSGFPVIDAYNYIIGYVTHMDLETFARLSEDSATLTEDNSIINKCPITVRPDLDLEMVIELFHNLGPSVILVEEEGVLKGLVTRKDVLRYMFGRSEGSSASQPNDEWAWDILQGAGSYVTSIAQRYRDFRQR
uniref:Chloride channel protein n=1 Tax=Blastobotrys adeninivorans TaxID=409370 RepID=A0A060TGG8_BLAAD